MMSTDISRCDSCPCLRLDCDEGLGQGSVLLQITWRACDDTEDTGPKLVVAADGSTSHVTGACETTSDIDNLIYNKGKVDLPDL